LADALAVSRKFEEALDLCLEVIQTDRDGAGQEAKSTMLKIFDLIGPSSALVSTYRRKLATALY
jgi:putative thioredoxin